MQKFIENVTVIALGVFVVLLLVGAGSEGPIEDRTTGLIVASVMGISFLISFVGIIYLGAKK